MIKFSTRSQARNFAKGKKVVDLGTNCIGSRWAVLIVKK